jgi:predicted transcriptional regulator
MAKSKRNVTAKVDTALIARLDSVAKRRGVSRSYIVAQAIRYFLFAKIYRKEDVG